MRSHDSFIDSRNKFWQIMFWREVPKNWLKTFLLLIGAAILTKEFRKRHQSVSVQQGSTLWVSSEKPITARLSRNPKKTLLWRSMDNQMCIRDRFWSGWTPIPNGNSGSEIVFLAAKLHKVCGQVFGLKIVERTYGPKCGWFDRCLLYTSRCV